MADISQYLKKARQMDEEKGVAYKATPSTSTNSGAYTPSKSGVDISSYLKKAREMDANNATVSMPNANSQQKDERKQQQYLSYLAGLDLDAQKKKAEELDKAAKASRPTNYFADTPQDSSSGYFDVAPETYQASQKTKEEAEADLAWKDYNLAKSLQYSIAGEQALDALSDDVYADVDKLAQAWLSPDIYNTIAQGSTERLRSAGYTDAEIEQLVDYRKRQINRSEYDEKVAKTEDLANNGFWGAAGASVASVPQQLASGAGYIDLALQKLQNAYSGNDRPLDYYTQAMSLYGQSNAARSTVTQNIEDNAKTELGGKIGSFLYNTGMSMADFISVAPLGGAGMALLGTGAATATAADIRDRGGDDTQALLGGALAGAAEAVFENESLKSLFALSKPVAKETLRSGFKRVLTNIGKQGWEEGKEELFTSLANAMTDRMVMGDLSSYNTAIRDYMAQGLSEEEAERKATLDFIVQCATDTLAGFVSGGVMGGVSTAARGYANYSSYDAKDLVNEALEINPDNAYAQGVKAKLDEGKRVGVGARYKLVQQNESAMRAQDKDAIQSAAAEQLTALGEAGDVQAIAAAIAKQTAGEKLDKAEKAAIKDSEHGTAVAEDLNPDNAAEWARQISTNKVNRDAYNADLEALAEEVVSEKQQADAEINKASEIGSQRLAANDQVYQTASKMFGEDKAFAVAAAYRSGANGLSAGEFLTGFAAAHQAGVKGTSLKKALAAQSKLRPEQVKIAWALGNDERTSGIEVRNVKRQGTGTFTDKSTGKATDSWQAFTTVLEGIAKRTGIDIETVDAIKAGSKTANGKMVRDMMTLVLSRNAENNMQSLGHELGEFVEAFNPEDMASLRVEILRYWAKTQSATSVDSLIKAYQGTYKKVEGGKTYEQAESEAINDALGAILASNEGVDALMEWLQSDSGMNADEQKTFLQKLADLFQSIVNALKNLLSNGKLTPMQQDMVHMEIEQKQDILKRLFAAVDQAAINAKESGEYYADITLAEAGIAIDRETDSVHSLQFSTAFNGEVKVGKKSFDTGAIVNLVAAGTKRSIDDARKWVNSELTIANIVMQNPEFLDFAADNRYTAIKNNSDYPQGTVDLSNLCPKREEFTTMFDMLQKTYPDKLFTAADVAEMRAILKKNNITVACGACFVEDRRQLLGEIADTYINMWKEAIASGETLQKVNAEGKKVPLYVTKAIAKKYGLQAGAKILATDTYVPTQYDLTTYEGFKTLQKNHPIIAMGFERYNNSRGQQAARLIEGRAEYDRQILGWSAAKVKRVNNSGGLRIFSFSDFEVVHLLDLVQVIMDCAAMGVKIQGYTKIPAFARLVRNTGIKLNRSHIPKGDTGIKVENGKRVLDIDTVEGIDSNDENFMDESDNPDVGDVIIGINPEQIGIAMLDDFIDYIIPFHSNKSKDILRKLGTGAWVNYKESQHEKDIATGKASKHNVNIYTDVLAKYNPQNKVEFVEAFLKECKAQGKIPRYAEFLNVDEKGNYAYREGYHKLLVDFKMFDKAGNILPQTNIQPVLDDAFMAQLLEAEVTRKKNYKFPDAVYKAIDEKFGDAAYSISPNLADDLAAVRKGTFNAKSSEVYVGESSAFLVGELKANPLSVTMPPRKAYSAMVTEEEARAENRWESNLDYHGLGEKGLYAALVASETPVAAFASQPDDSGVKRENRIVLVTDYVHNGKPVAVVEEVDSIGRVSGKGQKVNKTVTAFDREWLFGDIRKAAADGRLLAYDKKRSQTLAASLETTPSVDLRNVDFNANIRHFWEGVKWAKTKKDRYTAAPPQETKTALAAAFEKAEAIKENATHDEVHSITPDRQSMSVRDSDGRQLSAAQQEFFKDSKVRDKDGNLMVMYHGTNTPNFTVFDPSFSDDKRSLFFTSSPDVADSYTTVQHGGRNLDPYRLPHTIKTLEEYNQYMEDVGSESRIIKVTDEVIEKARADVEAKIKEDKHNDFYRNRVKELESLKGKFIHYNGGLNYITREGMSYDTAESAIASDVNDPYWVTHRFGNRYSVYLNMTNPYILDAGKTYRGVSSLEIRNGFENTEAEFEIDGESFVVTRAYRESYEDFAKRFLPPAGVEAFMRKVEAEREKFIQEEMKMGDQTREEVIAFWSKYGGVEVEPFTYKVKNADIDYTEAGVWRNLEFEGKQGTTRDLAKWAQENGHDGVIIENLKDIGGYSGGTVTNAATIAIAFNSNQVKSTSNVNPTSDPDIRYSIPVNRNYAPTFYSHMARVVDAVKQEKLGAASVVSMLRGKGVKAEEIKWSGIEAWLEGKKSVTKAELQDFIAGSMLQIKEKIRTPEAGEQYTAADTGELFLSRDDLWAEAVRRAEELGYDEGDVEYTEDYRFRDGPTFTVSSKDGDIVLLSTVWLGDTEAVKWDDYKLNGGKNYREIEFVLPNSDYSNYAMNAHWGAEAKGVLAHARIQDMMTAGGKMLFVEEIQSDWHNEGRKSGYSTKDDLVKAEAARDAYRKLHQEMKRDQQTLIDDLATFYKSVGYDTPVKAAENDLQWHPDKMAFFRAMYRSVKMPGALVERVEAFQSGLEKMRKLRREEYDILRRQEIGAPDAPFRDTYQEFVMKRLIRMAAEGGYDSIGWTTADIQSERWSGDYAEGYRIEYDQDIPKFMAKYGKKWGAKVGKTEIEGNGELVYRGPLGTTWNSIREWRDYVVEEHRKETGEDYTGRIKVEEEGDTLYLVDKNTGERLHDWGKLKFTAGNVEVWSMTIPEAMKESVLYEGQPQYSLPVNGESMTKMTDREILSAAAEQVEATSLTNAERDALRIFNNRLNKLGELQSKRKELGDLYREQMFVKGKVDRVKAANTRSRMDALDNQIARAENEVLKAENTEVLKQVLKQARKVVAIEQRAHDNNTLQRYKERRNNAADVKKYRERVQKKSMKLAEMLMRNSDKQHIPEQLKGAVGEFLTSIDLTSRQQLRGGEATKKDLRYTDTLNKLRRVLQNQVNYMEDPENSDGLGVYLDMPDGFVQAIDNHIEAVGNTLRNTDVATGSVNVMTADELKDLDFFLTVLTSSINKVNAFIANGRYELVSKAAMNSIAYLNEMREFGGKHAKVDKFLNWDNTTPYFAFKRFGDAGSAIFESLQDGWDKLAFNSKQVIDFAQKTYTEKEVKEWSEKIHNIELDGRTAQMTTAQIMSLYCLVKREQARGHLFGGGMRIGNIEIKGKVKGKQDLQQAEAFHLTMDDVGRITKLLTERQVAVAEAMQKYMNTVGSKWGNEISFSRFGYNSFTEENYFPIESDRNNLPAIDPETRANDLFRLLNMCFTKGLTPKANNALVVNNIFDVFAAHMSDMAKYNALALPVLDAMKFYNFKDSTKQESGQLTTVTVQKAIERAYGGSAKSYFIQFMKDLNGVNDGGRNESESFAMKMVGNYKVAAVGANLRVAFLQPTSYVRAVAVIDPTYLAKAVTMKPATKEMLEHSGVAVWKSLGFYDTNIGRAVRDQIKGEATVRDKLVEASMSAAALGDNLTWGVLWNACKLECAAKGEKSVEAVAKRFREVVYATQVVDSTMTRSQTMRSTSSMTKMLTSFMSEPTLSYNMLVDSYNEYRTLKRKGDKNAWQKCRKTITRSMMAYAVAMTAAALAESLFDALRDDDDYETFLEKFWEAFWGDKYGYDGKPVSGNLAADLNLLNKLPIIKDIVSEITGYENTRMDTQWFSSIIDAADAWKSDTRPLYGKIYKTMQALSRFTGLPVSNLMREVVTIYNNTIGAITGDKLKTYEGRVKTNIKDAMAGGHLTEDEAMRELVNNGEAKDMNEAYFIVKGWGTGDTSRYQDVYDAMLANESIAAAVKELTDHGYEKKDVLSTVKSQIGKWYKGTDDKPASITRHQALSMLVKYGELTRDEAISKLNTWDSQKNK